MSLSFHSPSLSDLCQRLVTCRSLSQGEPGMGHGSTLPRLSLPVMLEVLSRSSVSTSTRDEAV